MSEKPARDASGGTAAAPLLRQLHEVLSALEAESDATRLAKQVVEVLAAQPGVAGARLWRLGDGEASVWQQSGSLPRADDALAQKALASHGVSIASGRAASVVQGAEWACALGANDHAVAVVEACGTQAFDENTRSLLELVGRFFGLALTNTQRRHAVEELSTIVEATKRLNSTLDLGELINIILQLATRQTGADRGTVFLVDRERNEIWSLVGLGLEQQEIRLAADTGIAGWVASHGETVNLEDAYQDPRFHPEVDRRLNYRTRTLLCLPIRNKDGDAIGVLQLLNKRSGAFTSGDEGFLHALSVHVALALENARLHRELLAKQRMERDLALARSIQLSLLPERPPQLEGFDIYVSHAPSQMVGGDYYDFVPMTPQTLLTVIADVEGKGVASALVMANLQATLRALVAHLHSLERIMGTLNDMILADTRAQKFLSMFVGLLDQRQAAFHYINAGHVPPAVIRANGENVYLREGGIVVGVFPKVSYDRGYIRLDRGDILVSCTDGITEAMDVHGNEYGLERLVDAVRQERHAPAQKIVETVLTEVDRYSRGGLHEDDRVISILKVL